LYEKFYVIINDTMKKILILTNDNRLHIFSNSVIGGGYVVTKNLIDTLGDFSDVDLTVMSADINDYDYKGIHFVHFDYDNFSSEKIKQLENFISDNNFDIVLTLNLYQMYKNSFLQSHSMVKRCSRSVFPINIIRKFLLKKRIEQEKKEFSYSDENSKFFAMSEIIKEDYVENFNLNPEHVHVVYPGCKQVFENCPEISKKDKITFGIIAGSSINKGGHLFMLALGFVKLLGLDFNVNIIAPKFKKDFVMNLIVNIFKLKKRVKVWSFQEDMSNFYKETDVLVLPSLNEAFGLVVPEAMSYGHFCLVSSTAGSAEIIENGKNGYVFNRGSFINFVSALKNIINIYNNDFEKFVDLSKKAFESSKLYSWKNFALNIINKF